MNESQPTITKALIFAYFAHRATPLERRQIEEWLKTPEALEAYFTYLDEWERQFPQFSANVDTARAKFKVFAGRAAKEDETRPDSSAGLQPELLSRQIKGRIRMHYPLAVAATFVILIGLWAFRDLWYYQVLSNGDRQHMAIKLQDGSRVALGPNSSLKYARFGFDRGTRHVWLTGEAEFNVAHTTHTTRFRVHTPDKTVIEVLGTVFVVNSRRKATEVLLKNGSIRLTTPLSHEPVTLAPGDLVTISPGQKVEKRKVGPLAGSDAWRIRQFEFRDTPLLEVAKQLNEAYGIKVHIVGQVVGARRISGTFQSESADDLLEAIALMLKLEIEKTPEGYHLRHTADR